MLPDVLETTEPVDIGQAEIQQHHVDGCVSEQREDLRTRRRLPDDFERLLAFEGAPYSLEHERVVVDDEDSQLFHRVRPIDGRAEELLWPVYRTPPEFSAGDT